MERGDWVYKLCKTEQSASRQHELEAGLLAFMGTKRYEEISVSDLCDHLAIPRKAFYRYFTGKDGALHALLDHTLMEYEGFSYPQQGRTLQGDMERFFRFWMHQKPLLDALHRSGISGLLIERAVSYALSAAVLPQRFLLGESREVQEQVTMFAVCGLMSMVITWHRDGFCQSIANMASHAVRLLSKPLFPDVNGFF